jgi:hypothetical protein
MTSEVILNLALWTICAVKDSDWPIAVEHITCRAFPPRSIHLKTLGTIPAPCSEFRDFTGEEEDYLNAAARQRIPCRISRSCKGAYPRTTPVRFGGVM